MPLLSWHSPLAKPRVFVSYSAEQRAVSERLALTLMGMGYSVFYDRHRLAAGESFTRPLLDALDRCALLVFLVSSRSVAKGHFALSELAVARRRWPHPAGRVLAVMVDDTPMDALPAYLRVTSVLQPQGDVVADTVTEVDRMARSLNGHRASSRLLRASRRAAMLAGIISMVGVPVAQRLHPELLRAIFDGDGASAGPGPGGGAVMAGMPPFLAAGEPGDTVTILARCVQGEQRCFEVSVISSAAARSQVSP